MDEVVVSSTYVEAAPFEVPASVDVLGPDRFREARLRPGAAEALGTVPGLLARDRQNQAQDVQLSIRGFGARSAFGIRGLRLYVDGIPATMPDGQGQVSHADLATAGRIEVMRGPFSALHGTSSGGVIQVFTEEPQGPPRFGFELGVGSDDALRWGMRATGTLGGFGYTLGFGRDATGGLRAHSESSRSQGNARLVFGADPGSRWTLVANTMQLHLARDPLGLPRERFEVAPRSVVPAALAFDPRKRVAQTQAGLLHERRIDDAHALRVMVYGGQRSTGQFLAIPVASQLAPGSAGGVVDLERSYGGLDLRWTWRTLRGPRPLTLVAGIAHDAMTEQRRGYENFDGETLGVRGALRRDEDNRVAGLDRYLQASWRFAERWSLEAGLRRSTLRMRSQDRYLAPGNGDDSGSLRHETSLPSAALAWRVSDTLRLYAAAARGYEVPTISEVAYRPDGAAGLNLGLRPSRSANLELGLKARIGTTDRVEAALFSTRTRDEIVVQSNTGGRASYRNAGGTERRGVELAWARQWSPDLSARLGVAWLDASFRDAFATCAAAPCARPDLEVPAGNAIPGVARSAISAVLAWTPPAGLRAGFEARHLGRVPVDDRNTDRAPAHTVLGAWAGYLQRAGDWELRGFARVDNLLDRRYAGSVIVNEGNARFFEPAPGRHWSAGVSVSRSF